MSQTADWNIDSTLQPTIMERLHCKHIVFVMLSSDYTTFSCDVKVRLNKFQLIKTVPDKKNTTALPMAYLPLTFLKILDILHDIYFNNANISHDI